MYPRIPNGVMVNIARSQSALMLSSKSEQLRVRFAVREKFFFQIFFPSAHNDVLTLTAFLYIIEAIGAVVESTVIAYCMRFLLSMNLLFDFRTNFAAFLRPFFIQCAPIRTDRTTCYYLSLTDSA